MRISDWSSDVCSSDLNVPGSIDQRPTAISGLNIDISLNVLEPRFVRAERAGNTFGDAPGQPSVQRRPDCVDIFADAQRHHAKRQRTEERRVGKEGVSTG